MWFAPFIVGIGFAKLRGQTWTASALYSGAVTWTAVQVRRGALWKVASAGHRVLSLTGYQVMAGVGLGVVGGIATSQLLFGDEGRKDAIDFYSGKVSAGEIVSTLAKVPGRILTITEGNRAVENNAAGLPTGQNIHGSHLTRTAEGFGISTSEYQEYGLALQEFQLGYTNIDPRV